MKGIQYHKKEIEFVLIGIKLIILNLWEGYE